MIGLGFGVGRVAATKIALAVGAGNWVIKVHFRVFLNTGGSGTDAIGNCAAVARPIFFQITYLDRCFHLG